MPFDFFNPSDLAFGSKLRSVFHQLNNLVKSAEENVDQYSQAQEYLEDYDRRNYRVARPIEAFNPCRADEFFSVINNRKYIIHNISYNVYDRKVYVDVSLFNDTNNRMTRITGETDIREGYCYYKQASSNLYYQREAVFSEEPLSGYKQLFYYRVGRNNNVIISGKINELGITPYDSSHYSKLQEDSEVASYNESYMAKDYECLCVIGNTDELRVRLNGGILMQGYGVRNQKYCIVYVKPGDVISGEYKRIFRIRYFSDSNSQKEYYTILWNLNNLNLLDEHLIFSSSVSALENTSEVNYAYRSLIGTNGRINNSDTNRACYYLRGYNLSYIPLSNSEVRLCGLKVKPQKGKGLYEDEEGEIYRLNFSVMTRVCTNMYKWSVFDPIGDAQLKVLVKMHNKDGDVVDSWDFAYHLNQQDWLVDFSIDGSIPSIRDYGTKPDAPDVSRKPKIHPFVGYFERKLPVDGYLTFTVFGCNMSAKRYNSYDQKYEDITYDIGRFGCVIGISNLSATFYKPIEEDTEQEEEPDV